MDNRCRRLERQLTDAWDGIERLTMALTEMWQRSHPAPEPVDPARNATEWTDLSDGYWPAPGVRVLLYRKGYGDPMVVGWWSDEREVFTAVLGSEVHGMTHWRPLPDGPEADDASA